MKTEDNIVTLEPVGIRPPDQTTHQDVFINETTVSQAESFIDGCEHCAWTPEVTLDYLLDAITDCDPEVTEYVLCRPAECRRCGHEVRPKTFLLII